MALTGQRVALALLAAALHVHGVRAAEPPAAASPPDTARSVPAPPAPALPPLAFERCPADTNLGCNPSSIPGADSTLAALTTCGPPAIRWDTSEVVSGTLHVRTLRYSATDGCGHQVQCTRAITWSVDHAVPVLPRLPDTTLAHDAGRCFAALALPARAFKPGSDSVAITYAPAGPFPVGRTAVAVMAGDTCGGVARDTFTVTVTTEICGTKFYDANGNGASDDRGEIAGWPVTLVGTTPGGAVGPITLQTGADGRYCFHDLLPGSYTVFTRRSAGTLPSEPDTVYLPKLGSEGGCPAIADFGEFCIGRSGGSPIASWSGSSAQKVMNDDGGPIPELEELAALCLRNPDGTEFRPTTAARFHTWLQSGGGDNMAYRLSVELTALHLNVEAGLVSGSAVVYGRGCGNRGPLGNGILVNDLLATANAELCLHGFTPEGSPARARQACLEAVLQMANTDQGFLQKQPCPAGPPAGGKARSGTSR